MAFKRILFLTTAGALVLPASALAQPALDRTNPAQVEDKLPKPEPKPTESAPVMAEHRLAVVQQGAPITVGAVALDGLTLLTPADFADILEAYVGRTLSPGALAGLADAIAERAHERGYLLATATIPPQAIQAGLLHVRVDEGRVDEVRTTGVRNRAVEEALQPLANDWPVTTEQLEARLLIAGDIDGMSIGKARMIRRGDRNILEVPVYRDRVRGAVELTNEGSRPIGPIQLNGWTGISQLLADDDLLSASGTITPFQPDELLFGRLRYAKRISPSGTEISVTGSYSEVHPGSYLAPAAIAGQTWFTSIDLLHPISRAREASMWFEGGLGLRTVRQERAGLLARRDRLTVARIGLYGFAKLGNGRLRVSATVSQGLQLFGATRVGDPLASRSDADGSFTSLYLWTDWTGPLAEGLTARVALATQLSSKPLLISEELGLGGGGFLRAYDYSERTGDEGAMVMGELRQRLANRVGVVEEPSLYGFFDGGRVTNLANGFGGGTLFSAGAGTRFSLPAKIDVDLGLAVPLSGPRYDSGNSAPVFNFRVGKRF